MGRFPFDAKPIAHSGERHESAGLAQPFARCHAGRCREPHARTPKQCANSRQQFNREAGGMLERAEAVESAQLKNDAERSEDEHPQSSFA